MFAKFLFVSSKAFLSTLESNLWLLGNCKYKSYKLLGASIKDYYTFDNEQGTATSSFVVYGRDKDVNNHNVIKETTLDKRTTHWVKERQTII